ncbi:single-stranded DNA-binding protein [Nocardia takedensis]
MYEAMATVIGTVVTHPVTRALHSGERVLSFRMASNSRRFDPAGGDWVDNGTLFLTVTCWRRLLSGVEESLRRGDPILVYGQLRSHEYRTRDGVERRDLEMRASTVGPDLTRCAVRLLRGGEESGGESGGHDGGVIRNTGRGSSAEDEARLADAGAAAGESAAVPPSAPERSAEPESVDA